MTLERVGKRVRVYWPDEEEWFEGTIQDYDETQGYFVIYDDGDERWEPDGHLMLVEGEEEAQTNENYEALTAERGPDRTPEMMEPPASPGSNYDDDYEETEQEAIQQQLKEEDESKVEDLSAVHDNDNENAVDSSYQQERDTYLQNSSDGVLDSKDDLEDGEEIENPDITSGANSDGESSVAESEMPLTFGKNPINLTDTRRPPSPSAAPSMVPVPIKGLLQGRVLRASGIQTSRALAPNAFVRVSFVESGDTTHASAMLRCKESLSTTNIIRGSVNPVWSEDCLGEAVDNQQNNYYCESNTNADFQLELLPRIIPPATKPAWHQLPGDVLFTIFSASRSGSSSRNASNEHIGQAAVSLRSLLQDLLTISPYTTRVLELRSRSGKRLGYGNVSTRSLFEDGRTEVPTLVASFRFIPTYETKTQENLPRAMSSKPSTSKLDIRAAPAKSLSRVSTRQSRPKSSKRAVPAQTSSSSINRRRFEKQVAKDNRSFAKRLEWKEARRTRQATQAKAQEKNKVTPPQHGARKHGHKASSGINRTKYVQQVAAENKAIGKRLQNILGSDEGARNPEHFSSWAAAEPKDSTDCDYINRDKLHAQDKRWQRQVELDFLMEKAQSKYQQQNQMVEEVMELQETVASLKSQVDKLNKSVLRLEILNKKDQHVRDCLLRAAVTSGGKPVKALPRPSYPKVASKVTTQNNNSNQEDSDTSGKSRKQEEWELLMQHRGRLQAEKQKLSQELKGLNQHDLDLDHELNEKQSKWEHAISTQLFHRQMEKKNAVQAQNAIQEMKRRQKALELSREEEEHWACYQAHQELTQLQIVIQILRDQSGEEPRRLAATRASSSSSTAVCDYLKKKIEKQKTKLQQLQSEVGRRRDDYHSMLADRGNESLRTRIQELQKLVFLCKAQATHVKKAERVAQRKGEQVDMEFQRRLFYEQTETEIVLKRPHKQ
ncbi:unnamed protein product [Phytophthora fragariaefolia]|uniref:Unnamed protein product n=1 Tax=Phytophthora fragariaefolia TaxID=1490495 RepID=A0A9W6XU35_9STRA|nr:unnamed protein product [Phytophthora fragariaefolia]